MSSGKPKSTETQRPALTRVEATHVEAYFSGPLPPPHLLAEYNTVIPNGAERILAMAEKQSAHRESLEREVIVGNLATQKRSSVFAFILALVVILTGAYLMATGKEGSGFAAIITSLASLVGVFAISKSGQRKERAEKLSALDSRRAK